MHANKNLLAFLRKCAEEPSIIFSSPENLQEIERVFRASAEGKVTKNCTATVAAVGERLEKEADRYFGMSALRDWLKIAAHLDPSTAGDGLIRFFLNSLDQVGADPLSGYSILFGKGFSSSLRGWVGTVSTDPDHPLRQAVMHSLAEGIFRIGNFPRSGLLELYTQASTQKQRAIQTLLELHSLHANRSRIFTVNQDPPYEVGEIVVWKCPSPLRQAVAEAEAIIFPQLYKLIPIEVAPDKVLEWQILPPEESTTEVLLGKPSEQATAGSERNSSNRTSQAAYFARRMAVETLIALTPTRVWRGGVLDQKDEYIAFEFEKVVIAETLADSGSHALYYVFKAPNDAVLGESPEGEAPSWHSVLRSNKRMARDLGAKRFYHRIREGRDTWRERLHDITR